jgi:3-deoxy-D-manno-octulosonic-acid transferase
LEIDFSPHEIDHAHIERIKQQYGNDALLYSDLEKGEAGRGKKVLIINNIGMLSRLYVYGTLAYVGGGFKEEAFTILWNQQYLGLPEIFGPIYEKFVEAKMLASLKLVFPINNTDECRQILGKLINDSVYYSIISNSIKLVYATAHRGNRFNYDSYRQRGMAKYIIQQTNREQ